MAPESIKSLMGIHVGKGTEVAEPMSAERLMTTSGTSQVEGNTATTVPSRI